jgi:hypothetical protein
MARYRLAKAAEHAINIEWLRQKIAGLRAVAGPHAPLLKQLEEEFAELEELCKLVQNASAIPALEADADDAAHYMATYLPALAVHYISSLETQTALDLEMHHIVFGICRRLKMDWVEGVLVRLSQHLNIVPAYRNRHGIPVLYGPPNVLECYLSLPGIYHELGHNVSVHEPEIAYVLEATVAEFFESEKTKLGPIDRDHRNRQLEAYDDAIDYWTPYRLAELFCDLFAGYVCGPANVISIMDLAMCRGLLPTDLLVEHPASAVRVNACLHLLTAEQADQDLIKEAVVEWNQYAGQYSTAKGFNTLCPPQLIELLAKKTEELIAQKLPQVPRYRGLLPTLEQAMAIGEGFNLEEIINAGFTVMMEEPDAFPAWRDRVRPLMG